MKVKELTIGKRMLLSDYENIHNAIVTKLEADTKGMIEVTLFVKGRKGSIVLDENLDLYDEVVESFHYPITGLVSMNFDKLKSNSIKAMINQKSNMIATIDEKIANFEKIDIKDL